MNIQDVPDSAFEECYCIIDGESKIFSSLIYSKTELHQVKQLLENIRRDGCPSKNFIPPFRLMKMSIVE